LVWNKPSLHFIEKGCDIILYGNDKTYNFKLENTLEENRHIRNKLLQLSVSNRKDNENNVYVVIKYPKDDSHFNEEGKRQQKKLEEKHKLFQSYLFMNPPDTIECNQWSNRYIVQYYMYILKIIIIIIIIKNLILFLKYFLKIL